jgi:signal transduction histidine kinase
MYSFTTGSAFIDRTGAVLAADPGFVSQMGLGTQDPTAALRARGEGSAELRALLAGDGPAVVSIAGADGSALELTRVPSDAGAMLLLRSPRADELLEQAIRSQGLTRVAAGLAHDIKNPLNAMALQLALLADKLSTAADASGAAASHLGALREQIGRVNEVVRRFLDVADPSAPLGYTDLGALLADTAALFGHDARRRRIDLVVEAPRGSVRTRCDPARAARLVLALLARGMAEAPEGGRFSARAEGDGEHATVRLEYLPGDPDPETGYYSAVVAGAAADLGGELIEERSAAGVRLALRLPRNERT